MHTFWQKLYLLDGTGHEVKITMKHCFLLFLNNWCYNWHEWKQIKKLTHHKQSFLAIYHLVVIFVFTIVSFSKVNNVLHEINQLYTFGQVQVHSKSRTCHTDISFKLGIKCIQCLYTSVYSFSKSNKLEMRHYLMLYT